MVFLNHEFEIGFIDCIMHHVGLSQIIPSPGMFFLSFDCLHDNGGDVDDDDDDDNGGSSL